MTDPESPEAVPDPVPSEHSSPEPTGQYVVVARRYRPQTFDELIGQEHVAQALTSAIESGRVGHAYLFTGARGVGKTSAARILARALNCESGPTPAPCNTCDICQSVIRGDDVDVLEIDGASNRGIDEIRQLRQNVGVRPSRARFKIYIIDEVHMLTKEAFNALLKTLEEPPEHVKFIFATTDPNKLLVTVLSRCQRFDFAGIDAPAIEQRLSQIAAAEGVSVDAEALAILARRAAGSMRDSQSLLEQLLSVASGSITAADVNTLLGMAATQRLGAMVRSLIDRNAAAALAELDSAINEGAEVGQLLDQLLGYFRDAMAAAVGCSADQFLYSTPSQADEIGQAGEQLGVATLLAVVQILEQTASRMRASFHGRTLAEVALVRISQIEELEGLSQLIANLQSGEAVGAGGAQASRPAVGRSPATQSAAPKKNVTAPSNPSREPARSSGDALSLTAEVAAHTTRRQDSNVETTTETTAVADPPDAGERATESASAAAKIPLTADNAEAVWQQVLARLEGLVAEHAAFVDRVCVAGANSAPNRLVASFPSTYTFHKSLCERPEQKAQLERALAEVTGQDARLEFDLLRVDPAEANKSAPARTPSRREMHAEMGQRPFVRRALELFDATEYKVAPPDKPS